jgi:hypothetical protein
MQEFVSFQTYRRSIPAIVQAFLPEKLAAWKIARNSCTSAGIHRQTLFSAKKACTSAGIPLQQAAAGP